MISLSVAAMDGETEKYGLHIRDLQDNITIQGDTISGTLKYVKQFTGFSSNSDQQSGNYLALSFESEDAEKIETRVVNGDSNTYVDLTEDKFCIYRIRDSKKQKIEVKVTKDGESESSVYDLSGLTLTTES